MHACVTVNCTCGCLYVVTFIVWMYLLYVCDFTFTSLPVPGPFMRYTTAYRYKSHVLHRYSGPWILLRVSENHILQKLNASKWVHSHWIISKLILREWYLYLHECELWYMLRCTNLLSLFGGLQLWRIIPSLDTCITIHVISFKALDGISASTCGVNV